jgi:hypothetical protein
MVKYVWVVLLVLVEEVLPGFVSVGPPRGASCRKLAVCSMAGGKVAPVRAPSILTLPFAELCELIGERDARSAWNLYRIGRDASADADYSAGKAGWIMHFF